MPVKKIGKYLIENRICDLHAVESALEEQRFLNQKGIYKPVGRIILETTGIDPEVLESNLNRQVADALSITKLFSSMPSELMEKISLTAKLRTFSGGKIIIHEGDQGNSFYQIISGTVRVFRVSEDGNKVPLATLGPGESFGEMALLTGEPRSASVDTLEASSLLVISQKAFDHLTADNPEFSLAISKILSSRVSKGGSDLVQASTTEKAYQRFVSEQMAGFEPLLIGRSRIFKKLRTRIKEIAADEMPVFITGENGTEKVDVAGLIHEKSSRKDAPFLRMDAKTVIMGRVVDRQKEHDPIRLELAQDSALFGHVKGALSFAPERRLGLFQMGDGGTVVIENIEHLTGSVQKKLADYLDSGIFKPMGGKTDQYASIRIIAASSADLDFLVQTGKFDLNLLKYFPQTNTLTIPPLRKRKKDLKQLVEYYLKLYGEQLGKPVSGIDLDVYKNIMVYDWPGNTDELKIVIRRAVSLSTESTLSPEDVLIGIEPRITGRLSFNILKFRNVRRFFTGNVFPNKFQFATAFFFAAIIFMGFFGNQLPGHNISLELTWGLWEPMVILSCILLARLWCAICPIGGICSSISGKYGRGMKVPSFIRNYGVYMAGLGLALIFLSEAVFKMPFTPRATAVLILTITLPAVILALFYRRRIWCRFICPLGKLVGFLSRCSILELRANYNICNNDCMDNRCYVGYEDHAGCPVFEAPFSLHTNQNCILCGNCIKTCPNQSPALNLRLPGNELWLSQKPDVTMAVFGSFLLGTQFFRGLEKTGYFHSFIDISGYQSLFYLILIAFTIVLAFFATKMAGNMVFKSDKITGQEKAGLICYAFMPLMMAFEIGFHLERLFVYGGRFFLTLGRQSGFGLMLPKLSLSPWAIKSWQIIFVIIGYFASKAVLKRLLRSYMNHGTSKGLFSLQSWPVFILAAGYAWLFYAG